MSSAAVIAEEAFNRRLDVEMDQLTESLNDIMRTSRIANKDQARISAETQLLDTRAASIVKSAETLLSMVTELKRAIVLNDCQAQNAQTGLRRTALNQQTNTTREMVKDILNDLNSIAKDLEA